MLCPKCKSEILDSSKFCPECGSNISAISAISAAEKDLSLGAYRTVSAPVPEIDKSVGGIRTVSGLAPAVAASPSVRIIKDRYELQEEIGHGGFSVVYKGLDSNFNRTIALKVLSPHGELDKTSVERFQRESSIIASLNHRNILTVYDCDRDENVGYFIVMEYIEGGNLRDYLKAKGKLSIEEAVSLMQGICKGLSYAHRKNLIHRDIKPSNIMLAGDGKEIVPKIVDFGLARSTGNSEVSISGYGMGTPFYMPPEQRRDAKSVNHTADIYALGKVFYEMLTGEIPDNIDHEKMPLEPQGLSQIIFRCVKSKPEERYFSVDDLLADIESTMSSSGREISIEELPVSGTNVCFQCSTSNKPEAKFCVKCGTGLTQKCPECDVENSIHDRHCTSCGTDIELFLSASSTLQKMEQYSKAMKWSRVVKERALLPEEIILRNKKGTELINKIKNLNWDAGNKQKKINELHNKIPALTKGNDFKSALILLDELVGISSDKTSLDELRAKVLKDELLYRKSLYLKNIDSGLYQEALQEGKRILEIIPQLKGEKIEGIEEIQESVSGLEQKLDLKSGNLLRIYATLLVSCITIFFVFTNFYKYYQNKQLFNSAINEANAAMQENRFEDAEKAFKNALTVSGYKDNGEALSHLQKAQDNIKAEIQNKELQKNKSEYENLISQGQKAIASGNLEEAERAFKKALTVPGYADDSFAVSELRKTHDNIEADIHQKLQKNRSEYEALMSQAQKAIDAKNLEGGERALKKVLLVPGYAHDSTAISTLQKIQGDIAVAILDNIEKQKIDMEYGKAMDEGRKSILGGNWTEAEIAFKKVMSLKGYEADLTALNGIKAAQQQIIIRKNIDAAKLVFDNTVKKVYQKFLPLIQDLNKPMVDRFNSCNEAMSLLDSISFSLNQCLSSSDKAVLSGLKSKITVMKSALVKEIKDEENRNRIEALTANASAVKFKFKDDGGPKKYYIPCNRGF